MSTDLVKRLNIADLAREWQTACDEIREGFRLLQAAEKRLDEAFATGPTREVHFDLRNRYCDDPKDLITDLERQAWQMCIERLGIRRMLSVEACAKLDLQLYEFRTYVEEPLGPITAETLNQAFSNLAEQLPKLAEELVREVFGFLRPWRSEKKTNRKEEIGPAVVLENYLDASDKRWPDVWKPNPWYRRVAELSALERVFCFLDGRATVGATHYSELVDAIKACTAEHTAGETRYFEFKCFRNGNLHVKFKRLDLVAKLNAVAGGKNLKRAKEAA